MGAADPFFSIIVPTYNRPRQLAACLAALAHLDYPRGRFQAIVVDDGGEVPLDGLFEALRGELDARLVRQEHGGPARARNRGAAEAGGEFLAFTDDDCTPAPDWLRMLALRFQQHPAAMIGGRVSNALSHNPYSEASQTLLSYLYRYYHGSCSDLRFFTSNNLAVPAGLFREMGGFDPRFTRTAEDRRLCDQWLRQGHGLVYAAEAVVYHHHALTVRSFCQQHFAYGRGAWLFHRARAAEGHPAIRIEPPRFYTDMLRYPFGHAPRSTAGRLAALLFLSQAMNAAGFFYSAARQEPLQ